MEYSLHVAFIASRLFEGGKFSFGLACALAFVKAGNVADDDDERPELAGVSDGLAVAPIVLALFVVPIVCVGLALTEGLRNALLNCPEP